MKLEQQIFEVEQAVEAGEMMPYLMPHILKSLLRLRQISEPVTAPGSLYTDAVDSYSKWHKQTTGLAMRFSAAEGKAMKSILKYLGDNQDGKDDASVLFTFEVILGKWHVLNDFIRGQTKLVQIDKNLIEIIDKIKRHAANEKAGPQRGADIGDLIASSRT